MRDEIKARLATIPYAVTIGVDVLIENDELTLVLPYQDKNIGNPLLPALHGGVIGGFMETAALAELMIRAGEDSLPKPIGVTIDYLRRGKPMDSYAKAVITRQGTRVTNVRVTAWQDDIDAPIATLNGHFLMPKED